MQYQAYSVRFHCSAKHTQQHNLGPSSYTFSPICRSSFPPHRFSLADLFDTRSTWLARLGECGDTTCRSWGRRKVKQRNLWRIESPGSTRMRGRAVESVDSTWQGLGIRYQKGFIYCRPRPVARKCFTQAYRSAPLFLLLSHSNLLASSFIAHRQDGHAHRRRQAQRAPRRRHHRQSQPRCSAVRNRPCSREEALAQDRPARRAHPLVLVHVCEQRVLGDPCFLHVNFACTCLAWLTFFYVQACFSR
jgi:hypothetical protein